MKKNLRMLCMGLAAAATSMAFAQEPQDFTSKLWNYDFEKGPHGWNITAESTDQNYNVWMPQVKGDVKSGGYLGHNNLALEIWTSGALIKDNSVSQTVTDLPDGTYVFGAYMMATNQSNTPNKEEIVGVYLFANDEEISVATNKVEGIDSIWGHSAKFNVAVEVTDGTLKVGAKCVAANINFTTIDNATLWYFGNMDKAVALDEMAKIDMQRSLAIADTCVVLKSDAENKAYLEEKMQAAKQLTTEAELYTADEELLWGMRQVRKSAKAYAKLADALAEAEAYAGQDWDTSYEETVAAKEALLAVVEEYKGYYDEGSIAYTDVDSLINVVAEAKAVLGLENVYTLITVYGERVDSISDLEGYEVGEYDPDMVESAKDLLYLIDEELALLGDVSAIEIKANCEAIFAKIQKIIDNPLSYSQFPIWIYESDVLPTGQGSNESQKAYPVIEGYEIVNIPAGTDYAGNSYGARNNIVIYRSPLHRFRETLKSVRFIVHKSGKPEQVDKNGNANFCVGEFAMYDKNDNLIPLTAYENVFSNCVEPKEGKLEWLVDGNPGTFFHTLWSGGTPQEHYIEVDLPDGEYDAFRFVFVAYSNGHTRTFPRELEITYVSEEVTVMQQVMVAARELYPVFGTAPGFNNVDLTPFQTALAEADELVLQAKQDATSVDDDEVVALTNKIEEEANKIKEAGVMMPEEGKNYRIISSEKTFVDNQGVQKAMTIHYGDSLRPNWLWWEDANKDSLNQEFSFEFIGEEEDKVYYAIKHAATGKYVSDWYDEGGTRPLSNAVFTLSEEPDSFLLQSLGNGEFAIGREGYSGTYLHVLNHNSGVADSTLSAQQGVGKGKGFSSSITTWVNAAYDYSGWFIREMSVLPDATKNFSDLVFQSKSYTLYSNVNILTFKADKACAFENLSIVNNSGKEQVITSMKVEGDMATVELESAIAWFSFSFDNAEGVTTVEVDGSYEFHGVDPKFTELQNTYNTANNKLIVYGTEVGQVADYKEFDEAMLNAAALLENGGTTEELVAAKAAIDSALVHLKYNQPVADTEYFIQSALPWMTRWNSEMDIFVKDNDDYVYWNYVNIKDMNHRWKFIACGEQNGMPAYYLKNVGAELYLSTPRLMGNANGGRLFLTEDTDTVGTGGYYAAPFNIHFLTDGKVAIADAREGNANGSWAIHPMNHSTGTGYVAHGYMITWGKGDAASAMRIVSAEKVISEFMTGIEDVEIADEQVAPAAKGIYDLYGRRIETPAATGIYIVDGKKRVIKK